MSWDIFVQEIPLEAKSVAEIPDDFVPKPIGSRDDIIKKICALVPTADFSDPAWGLIDGPDYSIEVNIGEKAITSGFVFHIRGNEQAVYVVANILANLKLRAFDPQSETGIFSLKEALASFQKWRSYRDQSMSSDG